MAKIVSIADMKTGMTGRIVEINGGHGIAVKLESMGIRSGSNIKKISQQIMRGPIIIAKGNTQVAIGFGMAKKIFIEI